MLPGYAEVTKVDALGLDFGNSADNSVSNIRTTRCRSRATSIRCVSSPAASSSKPRPAAIISAFRNRPHIFNLGHGIVPETPIAHVERLIEIVKKEARAMEWVKALHVISVIAWMAGMMYLPRLFVYHADAAIGSDKSETFKVMERRLYRGITTPAMIATWVFGLWMVFSGIVDWSMGWPWLKAAMVIALSGIHGFYGRLLRDFANDRNTRPAKFYRHDQRDPVRHRHRHRHRGDREAVLARGAGGCIPP